MPIDLTDSDDASLPADSAHTNLGATKYKSSITKTKALGPAAAAALQAGAKRKLPESFQKPPASQRTAVVKAGPTSRPATPAPSSSGLRIDTTITDPALESLRDLPEQGLKPNEAPNQNGRADSSHSSKQNILVEARGAKKSGTLPPLAPAINQQPKAPRRLPGSFAAPVPAAAGQEATARSLSANAVGRAGPSEHDTKVCEHLTAADIAVHKTP